MKNSKPQQHISARILATLCALLLVATMLPLSVAAAGTGGLYEGWRHISYDYSDVKANTSDYVTVNGDKSITVNAMESTGEFLYLNRVFGDGLNSDASNVAKFSPDAMTDFAIEFDVVVSNYTNKDKVDAGDLGAGGGVIGLAFMGDNANTLYESNIMARIDYVHAGFVVYNYPGIANPDSYTDSYVDGNKTGWHWRFNDGGKRHVKVVKSGDTISMDIDNGAYTFNSTLPAGTYPDAGYIGLVAEGVTATFSNVQVTNTTAGQETTDRFFMTEYEGWYANGNGSVAYDAGIHSLNINAMNAMESVYLNRWEDGNGQLFSTETMTDFVIEYEMSVIDYPGKAAVDGGNAGAGGGAVSLAFMGADGSRLDVSAITARIDYQNMGFMWRSYPNVNMPSSYDYGYVGSTSTIKQWHWLFNYADYKLVKVTKSGNNLTIDINGGIANGGYTVTTALDEGLGLPAAGYIGFVVENANVVIRNVKVTDTSAENGNSATYFSSTSANYGGNYQGWQQVATSTEGAVAMDAFTNAITIDGMSAVQQLYLNGAYSNTNAAFGKDVLENFTIEYDVSVLDYKNSADVQNGVYNTADGAISLAFAALKDGRLDSNAITARVDFNNIGFMWREYADIVNPYANSWSYVDGIVQGGHWRLISPELFHVAVTKAGAALRMVVTAQDGTVVADISANLPTDIGLPAAGMVGLLVENAKVVISNLSVTNTAANVSETFFAPSEVAPEAHTHVWAAATCTLPQMCACGAAQGETAPHTLVNGICSVCEYNGRVNLNDKNNIVTINPGETVYYAALFHGAEVTVNGSNLTVAHGGQSYNVTDTVSFDFAVEDFENRKPGVIAVTNNGAAAANVVITFGDSMGSASKPQSITANGDYTAHDVVEYYYTFTAPAAGNVTVTMVEGNWFYYVSTATEEGEQHYFDDDPVVSAETYAVAEGDELTIVVGYYDPEWVTEMGTITWNFFFDGFAPTCDHQYMFPCDAHCMNCGELTNPDAAHNVTHVAAVEATCQKNGNIEYWYCNDCGAAWSDEALTKVTNRMSIVTYTDHMYEDGACKWCAEADPDAPAVEEGTKVASITMGKVVLTVYEMADGSHKLVVSGTGAAPVWNNKAIYTNYAATIKTIVIEEGIDNIAYGAYKGMPALESVSLPSTLTVINGAAFQNCTKLSSINLDEGLTTINYAAFLNTGLVELYFPNSVTTMGKNVFQNCKKLEKVVFGASKLDKKTLPARTFSGCTALKSVDFGTRLSIIDDYAFNQCGLENLYLPANIKTVDNAAFYKAALKTIEIADGGATYLGWASFYACPNLETVNLGNSLKTISTWVFTACNSLKEVVVPNTVTNIGRRTFSWCKVLESVKLSDGMTDIKQELFYGSTALKSVTLPANLTAIGAKAFYKCIALTELAIPEGCTVAKDAFTASGIK